MDMFVGLATTFLGYMVLAAIASSVILWLGYQITEWWGIRLMFKKIIAERDSLRKENRRLRSVSE